MVGITDLLANARGAATLHSELGVPWNRTNARIQAAPPQEVMRLIREKIVNNVDVGASLDQVSRTRAAYSIRDSSQASYVSHLRCVVAVCDALREPVVPASLLMLRRYTAVCNNPVTLRGHLAAWRLLHTLVGAPWAGQNDPFMKAAQAGLVRLQPPPQVKLAIRRELAHELALHCLKSASPEFTLFGFLVALAYLFALRVPSELLRQYSAGLLRLAGNTWLYGPIRRKNCAFPVTLQRQCVCGGKFPALCPHKWAQHPAFTRVPNGTLRAWTTDRFNKTLREALAQVGVPPNVCRKHSSHDFRRGCAKDLLQHAGPAAMMGHCGWSSHRSALFYVSRDEVDQSIMASVLAEASDDDN